MTAKGISDETAARIERVKGYLREHGPTTTADLRRELGIRTPYLGPLLSQAEERGEFTSWIEGAARVWTLPE